MLREEEKLFDASQCLARYKFKSHILRYNLIVDLCVWAAFKSLKVSFSVRVSPDSFGDKCHNKSIFNGNTWTHGQQPIACCQSDWRSRTFLSREYCKIYLFLVTEIGFRIFFQFMLLYNLLLRWLKSHSFKWD